MLLLEPTATTPLSGIRPDGRDLVLVVGPEGGIDPRSSSDSRPPARSAVRLGDSVLRTSTAGPAAIAVLSASLGRW